MRSSIYLILSGAAIAAAHMEMTFPLPINSKFDKSNTNPDYSMTAPLNQDGSNFPCKGYLGASSKHVTASFTAGQAANFSLAGTATHGGGSCQVSLSYDNGKTFKVVNSILGGCPLQSTYNFNMPSGLPSGNNVVFSWSWFNKVGNREFYQNCALVNIQGTGSQSFLSSLPDMQVANVGNGCTSVEGTEVIPVNPGTNVQYGGSYVAGSSAVNGFFGAGLTGTCGSTSSNKVGAGNVNTPVQAAPTTSPAAPAAQTTTPATAAAPAPVAAGSCSGSASIICTGIGYTWAQCYNGAPVNMGAVAPGTICINGAMQFDTTGGKGVAAGGNAAPATTTPSTTKAAVTTPPTTTTTTKTTPTPTSSPACINKREARRECAEFDIKCSADTRSYALCSGGVWSSHVTLSASESCVDSHVKSRGTQQLVMTTPTVCTGTGISCSSDGSKYFICDGTDEHDVPVGSRCLEGSLGGGFVSWSS